jgi:hypothetical protein
LADGAPVGVVHEGLNPQAKEELFAVLMSTASSNVQRTRPSDSRELKSAPEF